MIDQDKIRHIAKLAKLELTEEEAQQFSLQLSKALNYFEQISGVETRGVEPMITPSEIESIWREDVAHKDISTEELVQNAPHKTGNLFTVPPVV